jgi:hypothetical protein
MDVLCFNLPERFAFHRLRSNPDVKPFACHATGSSHKGTTGVMREALPEGNSGCDEGSPHLCAQPPLEQFQAGANILGRVETFRLMLDDQRSLVTHHFERL